MQSKIAVLFFLAFMGLEDFKDQCVSLWKILLFLIDLIDGNLLISPRKCL